jgi:hypothetical protein
MVELTVTIFGTSEVMNIANEYFDRALAWTELIASKIKDEYQFLPTNTILIQ